MIVNSNRFNFEDVIGKYLKTYEAEAIETLTGTITEVAKESVKKLKATSPKRTGAYAKHWTYTVEKSRLKIGAVVYGNKPTYRLAHLLEHGHARRGGGRAVDPSPIGGHIAPVEEWACDEVVNRFIEKMER